jgi:hypothetical protein
MNSKAIIICGGILFACLSASSQTGPGPNLDQIAGQFVKTIRAYPKEKIEVFTDRGYYQAGERIWFRAYCLDSLSGRPSLRSRNLFVDLVNDKDSAVGQVLLNIPEGKIGGAILLPASLQEGYYWIRAYTANILAEDVNRMFVKPLYVVNEKNPDPRALSSNPARSSSPVPDTGNPIVRFFPEGGSIISGTTATIGFRIMDAHERPLDASGWVTDSRDSVAANFKTTLPGIGKFSFDAWNPRKYLVHIKLADSKLFTYSLPRIDQFASQLSVVDQNDQAFHFRVSQGDSLYKKKKLTYVLGLSRDSLCFAANGTDMYDVSIPKNAFPKGKATIFLFNDQGQLVSQRSVYVVNTTAQASLVADKSTYGPREKVKIDITVSGSDNHPASALFSISVTDDHIVGKTSEDNEPAPAFGDWVTPVSSASGTSSAEQKYAPEEMDLLMLTQKDLDAGWKFGITWSDAEVPSKDDNDLLDIKGKVLSNSQQPLKGDLVHLFSDQSGTVDLDTTDEEGHFQFKLSGYDEGSRFTLKLTNMQGSAQAGKYFLDHSAFPTPTTPPQLKSRFNGPEMELARKFRTHQGESISPDAKMLQPVTVKGQNEPTGNSSRQTAASYDQSKRVSRDSYIITSDKVNNGDADALVNAIKAVPGLNRGLTMGAGGAATGVQPLIIMDGVKQTLSGDDDNSFLMSIDPMNIDFVEILKGSQTAIYGLEGSGGVILINTSNKIRGGTVIDTKGMATIYPKGYYHETDFPAPVYTKDAKKPSQPDNRATIYWKGNVLTDANGKATVEFYTADDPSPYSIWVKGITANGEFFYKQMAINHH